MRSLLTAARKRANLTQAEIAEELGCRDQAVCKWEQGKTIPKFSPIQTLIYCRALGVSLEQLVEWFEEA